MGAEIRPRTRPGDPVVAGLKENPAVAGVAGGTEVQLDIAGRAVSAVALDDVYQSVRPDLLEGHALRRDNQIILGTQTLRDLGIGDHVLVGGGDKATRMLIVGRAIFSQSGDTTGEVNQGAQITFTALGGLEPNTTRTLVRFRLAPHADRASVTARISAAVVPLPLHTPEP